MKVEVVFKDRIQNYSRGDIVSIEEGPFLRALVLGDKVDVLNPPNWELDKKVEDGSDHNKQSSDESSVEPDAVSPKRYGRKGSKSSTESEGTSSEGHREPSEQSSDNKDGGGEQSSISNSE